MKLCILVQETKGVTSLYLTTKIDIEKGLNDIENLEDLYAAFRYDKEGTNPSLNLLKEFGYSDAIDTFMCYGTRYGLSNIPVAVIVEIQIDKHTHTLHAKVYSATEYKNGKFQKLLCIIKPCCCDVMEDFLPRDKKNTKKEL